MFYFKMRMTFERLAKFGDKLNRDPLYCRSGGVFKMKMTFEEHTVSQTSWEKHALNDVYPLARSLATQVRYVKLK